MDVNTITTPLVASVGIAGTLGGVLIGHFLTRSWQQRQWLQDRRKEEFKELITTLVECFTKYGDVRYELYPQTQETLLERSDISARCYMMLYDRIYIAEDIKRLELIRQWADAVDVFTNTKDPAKFGGAVKRMTREIVEAATKGL